jgi:hypothetical protein
MLENVRNLHCMYTLGIIGVPVRYDEIIILNYQQLVADDGKTAQYLIQGAAIFKIFSCTILVLQ